MKLYEVIMAGGGGTRFWPLSRKEKPKQFINVSGHDILLNETILRMGDLVEREDVYVVTNESHKQLICENIVSGIPFSNILTEPVGRNTAPCILYAASVLMKEKGDGVICVSGSDYHIKDEEEYQRVIKLAAEEAEKSDAIITIGITPTYAATGFGYIKSKNETAKGVYTVDAFVEKPDLQTAETYVASGAYTWNSGMFVFKTSVILEAYKQYLPEMYAQVQQIVAARGTEAQEEVLQKIYPILESVSVDYGIMEKADNIKVIPGDFGWSDVGSLDEMKIFHAEDEDGNIRIGEDTVCIDSHNCIVRSEERLIALVGVEDLIVVETGDTVLVCKKEKAQDVKRIVEKLKEEGKDNYL